MAQTELMPHLLREETLFHRQTLDVAKPPGSLDPLAVQFEYRASNFKKAQSLAAQRQIIDSPARFLPPPRKLR